MATLLSLPRELRDEIFLFALPDDRPAPESPAASLDRVELSHADIGGQQFYARRTSIFVEKKQPAIFPSLLLVNKQIHAEVLPLIQQHDANLVLDIMYVKEWGWWPTWLSSPYLRRAHFSTLYVQIRIFDPPEDVPRSWGRGRYFFRGDYGSTDRGPMEGHDVGGSIWDFFLQHRFCRAETWPRQWPKPEEIKPEYLPAEKMACFIWTWLRMVLSFKDPFHEPQNFYGGFGALEIRVNGEQRKTADLSLWLERLHREPGILTYWQIAEKTKLRDKLREIRRERLLSGGGVTQSSGGEDEDSLTDVEDDYADYHVWESHIQLGIWFWNSGPESDDDYVYYASLLHG
ncbi:hypothetical protein CPLU01_13786 [Colletotrichum plurivorum]|uniref:F-box domain-containing protein n=1 Tax=Colletotrichum plurivorum TaxID=2175906 RepID=A0A8H6JQ79_9PEZI|nr:hypothetical protein CPLU01_13786 [Colletotrichum plurivorum]